jgi:hypothetical protein
MKVLVPWNYVSSNHSHLILWAIDRYKINSGVNDTILQELRKGYFSKDVVKNFIGRGKASLYPEVGASEVGRL